MPDEPQVRIEILPAWIARVEVKRSSGDFGLYRDAAPPSRPGVQTYQLGYRDAPLYRLVVRPEAGLDHPVMAARSAGSCEPWTEALARRFAEWCARLTEEWRE